VYGGTLVVAQSGGPTSVINRSLAGVITEARQQREVGRVLGLVNGIEGALKEEMLDLGRQPEGILRGLLSTPASALGSCRHKLTPEDYERVVHVFRAHDVRYFLYIGGNDSMDTACQIEALAQAERYSLQVVGIPKTIDNDLVRTDHCPGYGSVARYVAQTTMDIAKDLQSMRTFMQVYVLEVMGRNAGWIAAAASLASRPGAELPLVLCLPELQFQPDAFLQRVGQTQRDHGYAVVVASESLRTAEGEHIAGRTPGATVDAFGHEVVYGAGDNLASLIRSGLGLACRSERPGTAQRSAMAYASSVDQEEAQDAGRAAVRLAVGGRSGVMVTLKREAGQPYRCTTNCAPLQEVANHERLLPQEYLGDLGVKPAFRAYAGPLIGGPLPEYVDFEPLRIEKLC
jgi:ATP-dependent phosphofructokinase / diphosphate-dependent phosphofructokinase